MSKRLTTARTSLETGAAYALEEAIELANKTGTAKFTESIDASINLGVDTRKSEQSVRGAMVLPHGTGKTQRVAVFARGEQAQAASAAGADAVGLEDLAEGMKAGELDYGTVIAAPDCMEIVGALGPLLGPRGLMPNPKTGTVTEDVATAVQNAKGGQVRYRADKAGIVHCPIGRVGFETGALAENLRALIAELNRSRPAAVKGVYIKRITVSATMGPGIRIDPATL